MSRVRDIEDEMEPDYTIVKDTGIWQEMDGATDLEKKLNSYLTKRFIGRKDIPSDECLSEARDVIVMVRECG